MLKLKVPNKILFFSHFEVCIFISVKMHALILHISKVLKFCLATNELCVFRAWLVCGCAFFNDTYSSKRRVNAYENQTGCAVSVSAATHIQHTDSSLIGDVDNNCYINISDATLLQKQLAEFDDLGLDIEDYRTIKALDVNNDNNITIYDVTST